MSDLLQILSQPELWPWKWIVILLIGMEGISNIADAIGKFLGEKEMRFQTPIYRALSGVGLIGWAILCIWFL